MHRTSEYGIAAHWRYKEGSKKDEKLTWLRSLLEWQNDMRDSRTFMENLKVDLFDSQVFIFSPKGDVFSMPATATPLDFAYQVHTDVGHHCVGAKVNGKIVPLDSHIKNGDIVEILTNKSSRPSLDWLTQVKTSGAKHKIKQWFRKEKKEENTLRGQEAVEAELARAGVRIDVARGDAIEKVAHKLNYVNPDRSLRGGRLRRRHRGQRRAALARGVQDRQRRGDPAAAPVDHAPRRAQRQRSNTVPTKKRT